MFPNSPNTSLTLLNISSTKDSLGVKTNIIQSQKEIVGSVRSITKTEYQTNVSLGITIDLKVVIQSFLYDDSKYAKITNQLYKVERTYMNGQFLELYLSKSDVDLENVWIDW